MSKTDEELAEIKKALQQLTELELARAKLEAARTNPTQVPSVRRQPEVNMEELKADLKDCNLGELVIYAIRKDLIRRGPLTDE